MRCTNSSRISVKGALLAALFLTVPPASARQIDPVDLDRLPPSDIYIVGEFHDDVLHHQRQADIVRDVQPTALVFEMLTPQQAAAGMSADRSDEDALESALGWNDSGWPEFSAYYPIFVAAPEAQIVGGALPPDDVRAAVGKGAAAIFGAGADRYGLTAALPEDQQSSREALQDSAHCGALPAEMLPGMVEAQRLRDAAFARAALEAFEAQGGPVVIITGNGHARDWGIPAALKVSGTAARVLSIGQVYQVQDGGIFDLWLLSDAPKRDSDPCDAFKSK